MKQSTDLKCSKIASAHCRVGLYHCGWCCCCCSDAGCWCSVLMKMTRRHWRTPELRSCDATAAHKSPMHAGWRRARPCLVSGNPAAAAAACLLLYGLLTASPSLPFPISISISAAIASAASPTSTTACSYCCFFIGSRLNVASNVPALCQCFACDVQLGQADCSVERIKTASRGIINTPPHPAHTSLHQQLAQPPSTIMRDVASKIQLSAAPGYLSSRCAIQHSVSACLSPGWGCCRQAY